jgi:hypothetical protein
MKWSEMYWSQDGKNTLKLVFGMFLLEKRRYPNALMVNSGQNALDAAPNPDPAKNIRIRPDSFPHSDPQHWVSFKC